MGRPFLRKRRGCAPPLQSLGMGHGETFSEEAQGMCSSSPVIRNGTWGETFSEEAQRMCSSFPVDGNGTWGMTFSEGCPIKDAYSVSWEVPPPLYQCY